MIKELRKKTEYMQLIHAALAGSALGIILVSSLNATYTNSADNYFFAALILPVLITYGFAIYYHYYVKRWLLNRNKKLSEYASKNNMQYLGIDTNQYSMLSDTMIDLGKRETLLSNIYTKDNTTFLDYSFAIYYKTKNGEYKAYTVYYSVLIINLPRILPNVFFDAKSTKGREYKKLFDDSQLHSLEGNFDKYFDTYFPTYYSVDSLSFITPEVMQVMIDACDYDIEISGNKLYLYSRLKTMPMQIDDMSKKATAVYKKLMNNIATYRDERLEDASVGRATVSIAGIQLRRGIFTKYVLVVCGTVLAITGIILFAFRPNGFPLYMLAIGLAIIFSNLPFITRERALRKNAKAIQDNYEKRRTK